MRGKRAPTRRAPRKTHRNGATGLFEELAFRGLGIAVEAHIQELVYDLLKDPEYQEFMNAWATRLSQALLKRQLTRRGAKRRR